MKCACIDCAEKATHTENSPYMDDYCDDCTWMRCDISFHGRYDSEYGDYDYM